MDTDSERGPERGPEPGGAMRLTVLGRLSGMPADGQAASGYLVETAGATLLLDCGPGIATAVSAVRPPRDLDAVVVTHMHADHCYDLLPLGKSLLRALVRFAGGPAPEEGALRPVPLFVPAGVRPQLSRWAELFPVATMPVLDRAFDLGFDVVEYVPGERYSIGDAVLEFHALQHVSPNCGVRVTGPGGVLAYTGDTGVCAGLAGLAANADLLLAEATLAAPDTTGHGHLSGGDAGRAAAAAGAGELVLTHFASTDEAWLAALEDDARSCFDGPVRRAEPGLVVPVRARATPHA